MVDRLSLMIKYTKSPPKVNRRSEKFHHFYFRPSKLYSSPRLPKYASAGLSKVKRSIQIVINISLDHVYKLFLRNFTKNPLISKFSMNLGISLKVILFN